jgi:hypothetical protein
MDADSSLAKVVFWGLLERGLRLRSGMRFRGVQSEEA